MTERTGILHREAVRTALVEVANNFAQKGWLYATSGNLSIRSEDEGRGLEFGITASGRDKERLGVEDIVFVNGTCAVIDGSDLRPSAETLIHARLYHQTNCKSVLHVHTVYNNLIAMMYQSAGFVTLSDMELIKAFDIWDEGASIRVPIVTNFADIPRLAQAIGASLQPRVPGVLILRHGIYVWGDSVEAAKRHVEAFEFLFEVEYRRQLMERLLGPMPVPSVE